MRMVVLRRVAAALGFVAAAAVGAPAMAASTAGDWPCVQRKMPHLSLAQMWSGPEAQGDWREDREIRDLANRLASRRLPTEEAEVLIADFATAAGEQKAERLALLFSGVFEIIESERAKVMAGIERYSKRQQALADRIREQSKEIATLRQNSDGSNAATDAIEDAQSKLDWDTRIYQEREQSLTYVCEVPVLFEQRAFALARMMLKHLQ